MRLAQYLPEYRNMALAFIGDKELTIEEITTGRDAWTVALRSGITNHAYALSRDITDAHIQTALESIMPNAIFKDKKRY